MKSCLSFDNTPLETDILKNTHLKPGSILSSQVTPFADDTKCFKSVHSSLDSYSLQQDIHRLSLWSRQWTLYFNEQKCVMMSFSPKSPAAINSTYFINSEPVHQQDHPQDFYVQ